LVDGVEHFEVVDLLALDFDHAVDVLLVGVVGYVVLHWGVGMGLCECEGWGMIVIE